jgi:hypothetical protein
MLLETVEILPQQKMLLLHSDAARTQTGDVGAFEARWRAEIWTGVSPDSVDERGGWQLDWQLPTPEMLQQEIEALLHAGQLAIAQAVPSRQ